MSFIVVAPNKPPTYPRKAGRIPADQSRILGYGGNDEQLKKLSLGSPFSVNAVYQGLALVIRQMCYKAGLNVVNAAPISYA